MEALRVSLGSVILNHVTELLRWFLIYEENNDSWQHIIT